jgi:transposase
VTDRRGTPLTCHLTGANRHDSAVFEQAVDGIRPIRRPRGRPAKLHADTADDIPRCHRALSRRHFMIRIAHTSVESSDKLGRHRWVVERTLAWLGQFRRLTIRYGRRADIHQAFLTLGCALICFTAEQRFC